MPNFQNKLDSLTDSSVWVFTKQAISFDNAFKSVKLLTEMPNNSNENIEDYFAKNCTRYGIGADRHRVLIISQLFGLLTKTPPYERGHGYNAEQSTEIFALLDQCQFESEEYNKLKTEQILKVKIRAIIDIADNNKGWNILPVIFAYKVLKILKDSHNINSVNLNKFYTYIMTCSDYSVADSAVEFIKDDHIESCHVKAYKDRSRFITLMKNNLNLFNITSDDISINNNFDDYFNKQFMERFDIDELNIQLARDVDYTYFLTTHQEFNINLIDQPSNIINQTTQREKIKRKKVTLLPDGSLEDDDVDYVNKVDEVNEGNINVEIGKGASKVKPTITTGGTANRYSKNPIIGKIALKNADYKCEHINEHSTFISSKSNKQFMEAHHLVPISNQKEIWDSFHVNIDCVENIVSLCPNCHRAIHHAREDDSVEIITSLYSLKIAGLQEIDLNLSLDEVIALYFKV